MHNLIALIIVLGIVANQQFGIPAEGVITFMFAGPAFTYAFYRVIKQLEDVGM